MRPEEQERAPHLAAADLLATGTDGAPPVIPARTAGERARTLLIYSVLIAVALLFFVPFLWSVSTSLKTLPETARGFDLIPNDPTLDAYRNALSEFNFARFTANSFILAGAVTLANLVLASLGGYAFARLRFPGREFLFLLVLATLMIPDQLRLVPVYTMLTNWGLVSTYQGFVAIYLIQAVNLFLMRQYFLTIPKDYEEAAKLDNAGYFKTYWKVMLPLAGPALAAVTILQFQGTWNEFFWSLILLQDESLYTLPVGLAQFVTQYDVRWPEMMAGSVIAIVPIALIYVFFQRYFVAGVAAAGVKG